MSSDQNDPGHDRRTFERIPLDNPVQLSRKGEEGSYSSRLLDVSLKGLLVEDPAEDSVEVDDKLEVTIPLSEEQQIRLRARVAHVEEGGIGLEWIEIDGDSFAHLRRILELNLGDSDVIRRELSDLSRSE